ncbi:DUF5995 family protein [Mangrovivirga cuniculi]|uniref:Uncharacterized protein n=1 Tax=Mangrovivirga cuniculi TaxID=2715131 RepID=A0A4D7JM20_9BACT|nr:DUF5995 family protein [Mangrovivirga cuniculi]QCK16631.1 hypothetical protein DCC35_18790 [Mangrovivirga cuniculi]
MRANKYQDIVTIDDVVNELNDIIQECISNSDPRGYFAVLYKKVTVKVKEGIENNYFDDGARMEKLDVIFALRYIDAYNNANKNLVVSRSWNESFSMAKKDEITVLQHILSGINAHINLDLGIAAYEVNKGVNIHELKNDFDRINQILSSMVHEVQYNLTTIWPPLKFLLQKTGKIDDLLVDFSMKLARDGAWEFSVILAENEETEIQNLITERDKKVSSKIHLISPSGFTLKFIFSLISIFEKGSVADKINLLKKEL